MRVWIDIDNPPQVQYLMPLAEQLQGKGHAVILTARDYGLAVDMLRERGATPLVLGREFGGGTLQKARGVLRRAWGLAWNVRRRGGADVLISSSRSSAIAARAMKIPCFIMCDYEYSELALYRLVGAQLVHPSVIPRVRFAEQGWSSDRLIPFDGMKEDISFYGREESVAMPYDFGLPAGRRKVLFRPPAEESHYFTQGSRHLALAALSHLARTKDATTICSPRHSHQIEDIRRLTWINEPVVLDRPIPFDSLLAAADLVVSAGGTMLREAAWLGVPAISIFRSRLGAVDETLEREGRIAHVDGTAAFARAYISMRTRRPPRKRANALDSVLKQICQRLAMPTGKQGHASSALRL